MALVIMRDLNVIPGNKDEAVALNLNQGDSGFFITFKLYANETNGGLTIPNGATGKIRGHRNDNTTYEADLAPSYNDTLLWMVNGDASMTSVAGLATFELVISFEENGKAMELHTSNFTIMVEKSPYITETK